MTHSVACVIVQAMTQKISHMMLQSESWQSSNFKTKQSLDGAGINPIKKILSSKRLIVT